MKKIVINLCMMVACLCITGVSQASTIDLYKFAVNENGIVDVIVDQSSTTGTSLPDGFASSLNLDTGLGTLTWTTFEQRTHNVGTFLDIDIDQAKNTFFNEYGQMTGGTSGSPYTPTTSHGTLSWEIDEPGYNQPNSGNIYSNFEGSGLDNTIGSLVSGQPLDQGDHGYDDVSFALAWNFTLNQNEKATIQWITTQTQPGSGFFYLAQVDPDSNDEDGETIYFYSTLDIQSTGTGTDPIPEPGTMILFGMGLLGLSRLGRKKN